ncbi:MAG: ABC transporter ATP-binding protein [Gammaproteobacteria bacterium]|jgi:ATP-binding cassette subfamily B protein/subfamily B ATP-binding cassette protein MsbA
MRGWWLRLMHHVAPHRGQLAFLVLLVVVGAGLGALIPWPMKLIVDYVFPGEPLPHTLAWMYAMPGTGTASGLLAWLAAATLLIFIANRGVQVMKAYIQDGVGNRMMYSLGGELFDHLQRLSLRFHYQQSSGDLVRRVTNDSRCVRELAVGVIVPALTSLASLGFMFAVMWRLNALLAVISLLAALPVPVLIKRLSPRMTERTYVQQQFEGQVMALAEQTLSGLPVVQAFGQEDREDRRFLTLAGKTIQAYLRAIVSQLQFTVGVNASTAVGTAVLMAVGGFQVLNGTLSVGSLLVFLSYVAALYGPMETLAYLSASFAAASARARRVMEVLDADREVRDRPGAVVLEASGRGERGRIRFEDVSFGYEPGRPVLHSISLDVGLGETIALVGPTGAGKTTLVSLVPRFFDPWQGRVMLDGRDIRNIELESLRRQIALVLQDPFLLPLTAAENIAYGRPEASRDEIVAAAVAANADEFIREMPEGYDTVLSERGASLSGGQKQRLAIARALLKDAPILILDEPTSALDAQSEALLLEALERLMKGRTTFIIAHRLSTIRNADRILVLDKGRAAEIGTHQELLASNSLYAHLYARQVRRDGVGLRGHG